MKELLGGKGANLAEMKSIGLPVPDGFTITTEACNKYYDDGEVISEEIVNQIMEKVSELENSTSKKFGDFEKIVFSSCKSYTQAPLTQFKYRS